MTLGGTSLYGRNNEWLKAAVDQIQTAIEYALGEHLLLTRNQLKKLAEEHIEEAIADRVFGAILGLSCRFGNTCVLPCLTVNGRILRMYFHSQNLPSVEEKLRLLDHLLSERTAVSLEAAQEECFPDRGWSTEFVARQLLCHLSYKGRAVLVDDDLFTSPIPSVVNALRNRCG
jgi:hypothetical protein